MAREALKVSIAMSSYDHTDAIYTGDVRIAGVDPVFTYNLPIAEMFRRYARYGEWDISEIGLGQFATYRAAGDDRMVGLPIFTSRLFRHSAIYVRSDRVRAVEDLPGTRIGIPSWTNTAGIYARGMLSDMYGITPSAIRWLQGGIAHPGRPAAPPAALPDGVSYETVNDRSLEEMLWTGDIDGLIAPTVSPGVLSSAYSNGLVTRLFAGDHHSEQRYYAKTGIFPIMHIMSIQRRVLEDSPWLATNIYRAFEISKRQYFARLSDIQGSRVPLPFVSDFLAQTRAMFGDDIWPYGLDANEATLGGYLRYAYEQGVTGRRIEARDLFADVETFVEGMT
jgi:4,5-dihydroxyphthalate decarboxylase